MRFIFQVYMKNNSEIKCHDEVYQLVPFFPKATFQYYFVSQAGLLTCSLFRCLPIRRVANSGFKLRKSIFKSLQQRVLSGIYTLFPFGFISCEIKTPVTPQM